MEKPSLKPGERVEVLCVTSDESGRSAFVDRNVRKGIDTNKYLTTGMIRNAGRYEYPEIYEVVLDKRGEPPVTDPECSRIDGGVTVTRAQIKTLEPKESEFNGFNKILFLKRTQEYKPDPDVDFVFIVDDKYVISAAWKYATFGFEDKKIDLLVCNNPEDRKEQIGPRAIYLP